MLHLRNFEEKMDFVRIDRMNRVVSSLLFACVLSGYNPVSGQINSHQRENYVSSIKRSINIGDHLFFSHDSVELKNRTEYHLNNGLVYIREYYPNKILKSESYWINDTIPVYQIKRYNKLGKISKVISKSIGKYDILYVLDKVKNLNENKNKAYNLSLSTEQDDGISLKWCIEYDIQSTETTRSSKLILINSNNGLCEPSYTSSSDFPDFSSTPIQELRPTFPGNLSDFEKTIYQGLDAKIQPDRNYIIDVCYDIDTKGKLRNLIVNDAPLAIENQIKNLFKNMPDWIPVKINANQYYDSESLKNSRYSYAFRIILRKIN